LIPLSLGPRARYIMSIFTLSLSTAMVAIMLWYGYEFWHLAFERNWKSDTIWGVRLWIPYAALPIGFALFLLQLIADLTAVILKIDKPFGLEDS
jgi:TRAP-type C4-dicarboxylate transport system permease small subunit